MAWCRSAHHQLAAVASAQHAQHQLLRLRRTSAQWQQVKSTWRESWTPGRIVIAGLASGFLVGRAQPLKLAGSGGLLNMVTALSGLLASGSAQAAAENAEQAADAAESSASAAAPTNDDIAAIERAARGA